MKILGVIANCGKPRAVGILQELADLAGKLGFELRASGATAELLPGVEATEPEQVFDGVDAVVALGGDGTMLTAVRELQGRDVPLLGVNIGSLGFMTSVADENLAAALACLRDDSFRISERVVLEGGFLPANASAENTFCALNDIVITSGDSARVIGVAVSIDGRQVTSYLCDGLIISTPTGSTGHSLSAGGPILTPETSAFVLSPICPHTLSSRPLVVPDSCAVEVRLSRQSGPSRLSVDGQLCQALNIGDVVTARRCQQRVRFLHLPDYDYFDVLRRKLLWRGSSV
jgi:NAD+ kinase